MSSSDGAPEQACASCGRIIDTSGFEPFTKISCPGCGLPLRVERVFENYEVVEPLGTGGMGSVFKARDLRLHRFVALKLLRRELAGDSAFTARLEKEARTTASINHPNVVEVYSVGEDHGQFYVVMELVDGGSLDDRMEDRGPLPELETIELGLQVARGLQAALRTGLIHRDIKPGNILFSDRGTAKIVDFGLALFAEQQAESAGEIWGTPYYVAPERLDGVPEDFRSDLYSLGATLFHAVAGRPTFEEETVSGTELRALKANPRPLREVAANVSAETAAVIDRMLRPDPAERQASYADLVTELEVVQAALLERAELLRRRWSGPRRLLFSLGALLLLGALIAGAVVALRHQPRAARVPSPVPPSPTAAATPAPLAAARRELEGGHYSAAEALFRELEQAQPAIAPLTNLCAGLVLWERDDFAEATSSLGKFLSAKPAAGWEWMSAYRPLATERLADYQLYRGWEKSRAADPEKALTQLQAVIAKLQSKGALAFRLRDEEAALTAQAKKAREVRAAADEKLARAEAPGWQAALAAAQRSEAAYHFADAVAILEKVPAHAPTLARARAEARQRAEWLAAWKSKLISDINQTGFGGAVTDIHGLRYDGPVRRATAEEMELKTRYGRVMVRWLNLSPQVLLAMSRAFIRPGAADAPERSWLCAIFAAQTGQEEAARELAATAAAGDASYRSLQAQFFQAASGAR